MLKRRDRYGKMYFSGFADLGLGFAGIGVFENPRLQNPGFRNPEFCDGMADRNSNWLKECSITKIAKAICEW